MKKGFTLIELLIVIGLLGIIIQMSNILFKQGAVNFMKLKNAVELIENKNRIFSEIGKTLKTSDNLIFISNKLIRLKNKGSDLFDISASQNKNGEFTIGPKQIILSDFKIEFFFDSQLPNTKHIIAVLKNNGRKKQYEMSFAVRNYEGQRY